MKTRLLRFASIIFITVTLGLLLHSVFFVNYMVDGKSMEPSLDDGNMLMVNRLAYNLHEAKRFDVVVFHANEDEDYVKRIIGLPGDEIEYRDEQLFINNEPVEETFLKNQIKGRLELYTEDFTLEEKTGKQKVPPNSVFVMGDNRPDSFDSRAIGFIDKDQIVGKVNRQWTESEKTYNIWQTAIFPLLSLLK